MWRHVPALVVIALELTVLSGCAGDEAQTARAKQTHDLATRSRPVDRALFVDTGRKRVLYAVRGIHYGIVGRFVVSCSHEGVARTVYELGQSPVTVVAAVEGRGASRAAKLLPGERLRGGAKRSGIERWIVLAGGEPESIRLDATLLVRPERSVGCEFTMRGAVGVTPH
jgi:hypothetical protein